MHFYELHEGDNEVFADLLLAREEEMEAEEFFDVVQSIRRRVVDNFEPRRSSRPSRTSSSGTTASSPSPTSG